MHSLCRRPYLCGTKPKIYRGRSTQGVCSALSLFIQGFCLNGDCLGFEIADMFGSKIVPRHHQNTPFSLRCPVFTRFVYPRLLPSHFVRGYLHSTPAGVVCLMEHRYAGGRRTVLILLLMEHGLGEEALNVVEELVK